MADPIGGCSGVRVGPGPPRPGCRPGLGSAGGQGLAAPTSPSYQTGSKVTTVPVWAAWMMVPLPYGVG